MIFGLALALASEPSKLGQVRQMLVHLQAQRGIDLDFSTWALGHIDARVRSMALEYAHDAEVIVQILSFTGGTFASLLQAMEDLYQHEQITGRVSVKAKLRLRTAGYKDDQTHAREEAGRGRHPLATRVCPPVLSGRVLQKREGRRAQAPISRF
jgi:hypothetical protein